MSAARAYAAKVAAKLFRRHGNRGMFSVGEVERLLWRAWNDGARAKRFTVPDIRQAVETLRKNNLPVQSDGTILFPIEPGSVLFEALTAKKAAKLFKLPIKRIIDAKQGLVEIQRDGYVGDRPNLGEAVLREHRAPMTYVVHHLHHGVPDCGFSREVPGKWPVGHLWARDWDDVTCAGCLRHRPAAGTIEPCPKSSRRSPTKRRGGSATTSATRSRARSRTSSSASRR